MIRLFVDSGSSIRPEEKEKYGVEILPLKIFIDSVEYTDGEDLKSDMFYKMLIENGVFPKTSLPSLGDTESKVKACLDVGDQVIILAISSGISGTYGALKMLFDNEPNVRVVDTRSASAGIKFLVREARKHLLESIDSIVAHVEALIPRIRTVVVPETLEYLYRGGRLGKTSMAVGSLLQLKPIISLDCVDGKVKAIGKERGMNKAMQRVVSTLKTEKCDTKYGIIPVYTYNKENVDALLALTEEKYRSCVIEYDNVAHAIACHLGPNAFGFIFIAEN